MTLTTGLVFQYLHWHYVARQSVVFLACVCKCILAHSPSSAQYTIPSKQVEVTHFCQGMSLRLCGQC